jgi:urease accessory protein
VETTSDPLLTPAPDWLAWQLADSAFPAGGFVHSWGLEAAWQQGEVPDADALAAFLRQSLRQAGFGLLPLLSAAHQAPDRLEALDELCDAFLINPVANRASRVQGRTWLATCGRVWPGEHLAAIEARARGRAGHAAPITGAVLRVLGVTRATSQRIALHATARGILAAAVRLGIVGSYLAQRLQFEAAPEFERVMARCRDLDERHLAQTAPVIDLWQSAHDRLYSRLFQD